MEDYQKQFSQEAQFMRDFNLNPYASPLRITVPNARERIMAGLRYYLGDKAQWLPEYDHIADWLTDNRGRGLLCIGTCGLGKTLICQNILPMLIHQYTQFIPGTYTANEMNASIDKALRQRCVVVDDIGTESAVTNNYGNQRYPFCELVDSVERRASLLIITTNLCTNRTIDPKTNQPIPSIEDRYGIRTLDRLRAITNVVVLRGKSMRNAL